MTVQSQTARVEYAGNGVTTAFAIPFRFLDNSHILATLVNDTTDVETTWVITTNYTVTGARLNAGGTLTAVVAPATGTTLIITRNIPVTQLIDYEANDPFPEESAEDMGDKLTMLIQQLLENQTRNITLPISYSGPVIPMPKPPIINQTVYIIYDDDGELTTTPSTQAQQESFIMACSDLTTAITTGTSKGYFRTPYGLTALVFRAQLLTASSSGIVTVDINKNGSTILSTKLTIDANETTSTTAATPYVATSTTAAAGDVFTVDIDGAGTGAKGLQVAVIGIPTDTAV